jgi:hypothetical protein
MKISLLIILCLGALTSFAESSGPDWTPHLDKDHPRQLTLVSAMQALALIWQDHRLPFSPTEYPTFYLMAADEPDSKTDYPYPQTLTFRAELKKDRSRDCIVTIVRKTPGASWKLVRVSPTKGLGRTP